MKPAPFQYLRPATVAEALEQLASYPDAKVMAGGQSLMALMNLRLARPGVIVDIGRLDELRRIFDDTEDLILGALVTHRTVETDPLIAARAPLLADAARYIGHVGIRNRGTIGGSVAHADPAAEMPLSTLVLDATFHVESATRGRRQVRAEDMFVSYFTSALEPDELITWVSIPAARYGQGWGSSNTRTSTVITVLPARAQCWASTPTAGSANCGVPCSAQPTGHCCSWATTQWGAPVGAAVGNAGKPVGPVHRPVIR